MLALPAGWGMLCQFFDISICFVPFTRSASRRCALRVAATASRRRNSGSLVAAEVTRLKTNPCPSVSIRG